MSKKSNIFKVLDEMIEESKPKKRGRPKKVVNEKNYIEINEERFIEEKSRIVSYLGKLSTRQICPSEMISILQDLDVITETNGLSKDDIIDQLRELVRGK